jgi:flagellar hook-length control protein FliK
VRAATPAVEQTQPAPVDTTTAAETAVVGRPATPALPSASRPGDAEQPTGGDSAQTSNFIPATVKPAPAPVALATPDVETTAAAQLSESDPEATAVPTDAGPQAGASVGTAAAPQAAQPTDPQTPQQPVTAAPTTAPPATTTPTTAPPATTTPTTAPPAATTPTASAGPDPVATGTTVGATAESPTSANGTATTVSGQASAPTAKHAAKTAGPGAAAHGDAQTDGPTATPATAQPQAPSAGTQDPGQNGGGGQASGQTPPHPEPGATQPQPDQAAAPAPAANTPTPPAGIAATPVPQVSAAASTAATAAATGPARYGIGLSEAVETVKTTIELGSRQGFSQAKIQLAPATLGQITIHLQKTSDGIVAKVVADTSAAAQTMQQGGDDLRRSLQNSGLHLLRLDIETRGDQRGSANAGGHTSQSQRTGGDQESASAGDDGASQPTTIVLPNGALVNVLA